MMEPRVSRYTTSETPVMRMEEKNTIFSNMNHILTNYPFLVAAVTVTGGMANIMGWLNQATGAVGAVLGLTIAFYTLKIKIKENKLKNLELKRKNNRNGKLN